MKPVARIARGYITLLVLEIMQPEAKMPRSLEGITRRQIAELLNFLPLFEDVSQLPQPAWQGGEPDQNGVMTFPHPTYSDAVIAFYECAGQSCWTDFGYSPSAAGELVHSDDAIASASLAQIKTMLTFCVRGERFCDGHWDAMIREGRIGLILLRLKQLSEAHLVLG